MNTSKHTPGPWKVEDHAGVGLEIFATVNLGPEQCEASASTTPSGPLLQPIYNVPLRPEIKVGDDGIAYVKLAYEDWRQFPSIAFKKMQKANAYLIAAAPELLELIQFAFDRFTDNDMQPPNHALKIWLEKAKSVIQKAEQGE